MALSNTQLDQILAALSAEGFRFIFDMQNPADVASLILKRGEVLILEQEGENRLAIGNGIDPVSTLPLTSLSALSSYSPQDDALTQVTKLWAELQATARMYEVIPKTLPTEIQKVFIQQKPENFSFLLGEEIPKESPLYQFVQTMPDMRGAFLRNWNHDAAVDPDGNRAFGARQKDAFQSHGHAIEGVSNFLISLGGNSGVSVINSGGSYGVISYATAQEAIPTTAGEPRTSSETRPVNNVTLFLIRIY